MARRRERSDQLPASPTSGYGLLPPPSRLWEGDWGLGPAIQASCAGAPGRVRWNNRQEPDCDTVPWRVPAPGSQHAIVHGGERSLYDPMHCNACRGKRAAGLITLSLLASLPVSSIAQSAVSKTDSFLAGGHAPGAARIRLIRRTRFARPSKRRGSRGL